MHQESENSHTRRPSTPLKSISTSWYRPAESPKSEGQSSNASITKVVHDLDDAFDDREEDISTGFVVGHSLKRESVGGKIDVKAIISPPDFKVEIAAAEEDFPPEIRGMIHIQGQGHGDRECVQRPNLSPASLTSSSSLGDQSRTQTPPNLRRNSDIVEVPASPNTPSIVISRPPSPTEHLQAEFMDVSLTPDVERKPPLPSRSPIPAPIIVPPLNNLSNVEIIQTARSPPPTFGHTSTKSESSIVPNSHQPQTAKLPPSTSEPQSVLADASSSNQKRPRRATGLTNTQDVVSKTRPKHLPPKDREEDLKHLRVWKEMMEKSRLADEQRKKEQQNRRLAREMAVDASLHIWEREVLPDWKAAIRNPKLRKLWWKGIPTKIRGQVWSLTLGNELSLSKEAYKSCLARAKRAIAINSFPEDSMREIEEDIRGTLPALHLFHPETGPMYEDLKSILCAWLVARSDEGLGYVKGASTVAAMFLINMLPEHAFVAMRNLLERHCLRAFYGGPNCKEDVEAYYRIFDTLLADGMPKVYFNFKQHTISPSLYLRDWLLTVFLHHLPFETCTRVWDVLMLEGDSFLFRTAIGILGVMEARLFFPDRKELLDVLQGENKAAKEVARRSGVMVDLGARYEQYGMTEESLWERIESMDEWWKESTWSRLIQRELPDI